MYVPADPGLWHGRVDGEDGAAGRRWHQIVRFNMAVANGLDSAIVDPLDQGVMDAISAAVALHGRDDHCLSYIDRHRRLSEPH